jgi:hypothetical protein
MQAFPLRLQLQRRHRPADHPFAGGVRWQERRVRIAGRAGARRRRGKRVRILSPLPAKQPPRRAATLDYLLLHGATIRALKTWIAAGTLPACHKAEPLLPDWHGPAGGRRPRDPTGTASIAPTGISTHSAFNPAEHKRSDIQEHEWKTCCASSRQLRKNAAARRRNIRDRGTATPLALLPRRRSPATPPRRDSSPPAVPAAPATEGPDRHRPS